MRVWQSAPLATPRPDEVLVSQEVVDASDDSAASFAEIGAVELKGVTGPIRLHSARRA
jgi:class 3 adenylate cyclase